MAYITADFTIEVVCEVNDYEQSVRETDYVSLKWNDLDKAKEALRAIEEHYFAVVNDRQNLSKQMGWYDPVKWATAIVLEDDYNRGRRVQTTWVGSGINLISAHIILTPRDDLGFSVEENTNG